MKTIRTFINTQCSQYNDDIVSNIVVKENNTKYHLVNNSNAKAVSYRYDGCIYNDNGKACDYIIVLKEKEKEVVFLVELKSSSDLGDALKQIDDTLERLEFDNQVNSVYGRIALYSVPAVQTTWAIKLDRKLRKLNGDLKYRSGRVFKETFNNN